MTGEPETPWTAPDVERPGGSLVAPEAQMLPEMLAWHRSTLLSKCSGLTGEQLVERSVVVESGGDPFSLRFVYLHLMGEYARHNGHADLVRERVDGATGA
ncbi:hypothetical protein ASE25_11600 [Terrabacter sp. Root85]|uniref:mycothiol transferase n=1 Tax=Terrabacter sp. Root85 TaxID=1736603 RepID=UPI0006FC091F|nr:DUF664 domain-containing protein [Terrabacter sp. Root85]KRC90121.1 hypothetical protein ASE25_11600 [Terrabacter sp. Root85]